VTLARAVTLSPAIGGALPAGGLTTIAALAPSQSAALDDRERQRVVAAADRALDDVPLTITAFPAARSAGGLHDFFSEGDYWWPDPNHPGGARHTVNADSPVEAVVRNFFIRQPVLCLTD
jgi:hypothetical protein